MLIGCHPGYLAAGWMAGTEFQPPALNGADFLFSECWLGAIQAKQHFGE